MLVLGIDPGIAITGFGLIQNDRQNELACVGYGVINTPANLDEGQRLVQIYQALVDLIQHHQPQSSAVEKLFFQKNVRTALSVGQARGGGDVDTRPGWLPGQRIHTQRSQAGSLRLWQRRQKAGSAYGPDPASAG